MSDDRSYKVGQLLVVAWGDAKTVRNRVYQVSSVKKLGREPFAYYSYNIQSSNGTIELNTCKNLITFEEYKQRLHVKLEKQYSALAKQERRIANADKLEQDAKKVFKVDSKEEHCVTSQV